MKRLTADEVIARAGLEPEKTYMQTDTGVTDTGAGWMETLRDIERRGYSANDAAFDPDGDGAHLVEVCPTCGHIVAASRKRGWHNLASAENGKKGGRPHKIKLDDPLAVSALSSYIPGIDGEVEKKCAEQIKNGTDANGYYTVSPDVYSFIMDYLGYTLANADDEEIDGMIADGEFRK